MRVLLIALLAAISYAQTGCQPGCKDVCITIEMTTTNFAYQASWSIEGTSCSGPQNPPYPDNMKTTEYCCLAAGSYTIVCKELYGDGWDGATLDIQGKTVCSMTLDDGKQITKTIEITETSPPSQAPTYYGPQMKAFIQIFDDSSCISRTDDPPQSVSFVKDRCIDNQDDGRADKAQCHGYDGWKQMEYNNTNCGESGMQNSEIISVGDCVPFADDDHDKTFQWAKVVKLEGCGSNKSESFFNLENSLLIGGGCLIFVCIIGFAILYYCRKEKDDGPYSSLQQ